MKIRDTKKYTRNLRNEEHGDFFFSQGSTSSRNSKSDLSNLQSKRTYSYSQRSPNEPELSRNFFKKRSRFPKISSQITTFTSFLLFIKLLGIFCLLLTFCNFLISDSQMTNDQSHSDCEDHLAILNNMFSCLFLVVVSYFNFRVFIFKSKIKRNLNSTLFIKFLIENRHFKDSLTTDFSLIYSGLAFICLVGTF